MSKRFSQGDKVKLHKPKGRRPLAPGAGSPPGGITAARNGQRVFLPYGRLFQVSEGTAAEVANMQASPLPLISAAFINSKKIRDRFTRVEPGASTKAEDDDNE